MGSFHRDYTSSLIFNLFIIYSTCSSQSDKASIKNFLSEFSLKPGQHALDEKGESSIFKVKNSSQLTELVNKFNSNVRVDVFGLSQGEDILIVPAPFPSPLTWLQVTYPNVSTYLVFKLITEGYQGKVVYVRNVKGTKSVEWDFMENPIKLGSFASAFMKVHVLSRSSRGRSRSVRSLRPPPGTGGRSKVQKPKTPSSTKKLLRSGSDGNNQYKPEQLLPPAVQGRPEPTPLIPNLPDSSEEHRKGKFELELEIGVLKHPILQNIDDTVFPHSPFLEDNFSRKKRSLVQFKKISSDFSQHSLENLISHEKRHTIVNSLIFEGIGGCKKPEIYEQNLSNDFGPLQLYFALLRVQCHTQFMKQAKVLLNSKLVSKGVGIKYDLSLNHRYLKAKILKPMEWNDFISAIFLVSFSNAYAEELEIRELNVSKEYRSPLDKKISTTVKIMTTFAIKIMEFLQNHAFYHTIKIANTLIESLITHAVNMVKVDEGTSFNDQFQIAGLITFIQAKLLEITTAGERMK